MKKSLKTLLSCIVILISTCNFILAVEAELGGGMGINVIVVNPGENVSNIVNSTTQEVQAINSHDQEANSHKISTSREDTENSAILNSDLPEGLNNQKILLDNTQEVKGGSTTIVLLLANILLSIIFLFFLVRIVQMKSTNRK